MNRDFISLTMLSFFHWKFVAYSTMYDNFGSCRSLHDDSDVLFFFFFDR